MGAFAVAHSPLVKTALFASDPNWGRILAAVGRAGIARLAQERLTLEINGARIVTRGGVDRRYTEEQGVAAMSPAEIHIRIGLGMGRAHRDRLDQRSVARLREDQCGISDQAGKREKGKGKRDKKTDSLASPASRVRIPTAVFPFPLSVSPASGPGLRPPSGGRRRHPSRY
jgi:hypothetical protein